MQSHYKPAESFLYRRTTGSPWQQIAGGLPEHSGRHTAVLAAHPTERHAFYAAGDRDVFHSADSGLNWTRFDISWPENIRISEICEMAISEDA